MPVRLTAPESRSNPELLSPLRAVERPGVYNFLGIEPKSELTPAFERQLYGLYFEMRSSQKCGPGASDGIAALWKRRATTEAVLAHFRKVLGTRQVRICPFVPSREENPAPFVLGRGRLDGQGLLGKQVPSALHVARVEAKLPFAQLVKLKKQGLPQIRMGAVRVELRLESLDAPTGRELGFGFCLGDRIF